MRTIYIGSNYGRKKSGSKFKILSSLFLFLFITGALLKFSAPTILEYWINSKGGGSTGYAFSIRDVEVSFQKGQILLKDVKIFNPKTETELLEAPHLAIQLNWPDLILSQDRNVALNADKVNLILSKDLASELQRIQTSGKRGDHEIYLDSVIGNIAELNIIEKKEDFSRKVLELNNVNVKVKEVATASINQKTEFSVSSNIEDGGKLNLTGKTSSEAGSTPWSIQGSLKQVPPEIFNKIAGDKLPFAFNESKMDAQISAHSDHGKVKGEIAPDIKRLTLIDERPGIPTQSIARALNEDLTFTLPFTLKDVLTLQYEETYKKLKSYRRYPASTSSEEPITTSQGPSAPLTPKKVLSFWPF